MRTLVAALTFILALSGCVEPTSVEDAEEELPTDGEPAPRLPVRYSRDNQSAVEHTFTITVGPQDACVPVGCAEYSVSQDDEAMGRIIRFEDQLPQGTSGYVKIQATHVTDPTDTVDAVGNWQIFWWSQDLRATGTQRDSSAGAPSVAGHVTNHGPDPATVYLFISEPDGGAQPIDVEITITVTPTDELVQPTHVVATSLVGGPVALGFDMEQPGPADVMVRGPDLALIHQGALPPNNTLILPENSPPGEYFISFLGESAGRILVAEKSLAKPLLRPVDTTTEFGQFQSLNGKALTVITWSIDLAEPPALVSLWLLGDDGRSASFRGSIEIEGPGQEILASGTLECNACMFAADAISSDWSEPALTEGEYTFRVEVEESVGWQVAHGVSYYARA